MKENLKSKRGITLIALVITIIILLILAIITINLLLSQGIIGHANNAVHLYNEAQNNELAYLTYAEGEMDKYAGASGNDLGDATEYAPEDLQKYLLGPALTGRSIFDVFDLSTKTFMDMDDEGSIISASTKVKLLNKDKYYDFQSDSGKDVFSEIFYVKYNNEAYKVKTKESTRTTDPSVGVVKVYSPQQNSKEGTIVKYSTDGTSDPTDWLVLYDNGSTLDIMSVNTMGNLTLGKADIQAQGDTELEKAIYSYNNAVSRINGYCQSLITNSTAKKIRSIGTKFDLADMRKTYSSNDEKYWSASYNDTGKLADHDREEDLVRMSFWNQTDALYGFAKSDAKYWLASRTIYKFSGAYINGRSRNGTGFGAGMVEADGAANLEPLWYVYPGGASSYPYGSNTYAVRPVVRVAVSDVS